MEYNFEATLTTEFSETLKGFPFFLELEMLQGEQSPLPNGQTLYRMNVTDPDKCELLREFCLQVISSSQQPPASN